MIYESSRTTTEQMLSDSGITGFFSAVCSVYVWYETVRIVNIYDRQKTHSLSVATQIMTRA